MNTSMRIALLFSSLFFMTGLVTGAWKYRRMMKSADRKAPLYVDIAHRSSFAYSFAALLVSILLGQNRYPAWLNMTVTLTLMSLFTVTMTGYIAYGMRGDETTQFASPPPLGGEAGRRLLMALLIAGEIIGFGLLVAGFVIRSFG